MGLIQMVLADGPYGVEDAEFCGVVCRNEDGLFRRNKQVGSGRVVFMSPLVFVGKRSGTVIFISFIFAFSIIFRMQFHRGFQKFNNMVAPARKPIIV